MSHAGAEAATVPVGWRRDALGPGAAGTGRYPRSMDAAWLEDHIRVIADYPRAGISFRDITPLLGSSDAFRFCVDAIADHFAGVDVDRVLGIEARGFIVAAPIAYRIAQKVFAGLQPAFDGTYCDDSEQVARAIHRKLGIAQLAGTHPFVFPRLVAGVRFTEAERRRLAGVCRAKSFSLFDRLGIEEARGDRMLFVATVPATSSRPSCPTNEARDGGVPATLGVSSCEP